MFTVGGGFRRAQPGYHDGMTARSAASRAAGCGRRSARGAAALAFGAVALGVACSGGAGGNDLDRPAAGADPRVLTRPNIVWIVADALDEAAVAASVPGARMLAAGTVPGASAPASARAVLLTGLRPAALGLDEATGRLTAPPPAGVTVVPELLRRAGYYTSRAGPPRHRLASIHAAPVGIVHVDGGVHAAARARPVPVEALAQPGLLGAWDAAGPDADWRGRDKDWESPCTVSFGCGGARAPGERPFFALFNVGAQAGDTAEEGGAATGVEPQIARIVEALAADDRLEDTVVFLIGARGPSPTVAVRWPAGIGAAIDEADKALPVSLLDLAPTALALANTPVLKYMEGRALVRRHRDAPPQRTAPAEPAAAAPSRGSHPAAAPTAEGPPVAATPTGYPTGGLFHVAPRVDLWCGPEGAAIVYTTEREPPFYWRLYRGPFRMRFWTLRFQCGRLGHRDSDIVTYDFDIE